LPRINATSEPAAIGPVDIVLFAVKLYDTDAASRLLPTLGGPEAAVIPLQNGVDGVDIVTRAVGPAHTAGGTCYVSAVIAEPGGIPPPAMEKLIFVALAGRRSPRLEQLLAACVSAKFKSKLSENIQVDIWTKFVR